MNETNGVWGKAIAVPGTAHLDGFSPSWWHWSEITSISCVRPGWCAAGGTYYDGSLGHRLPFVVDERNGAWGQATRLPGLWRLNRRLYGVVTSVSCAAGSCAAVGQYVARPAYANDAVQAFVAQEAHGVWSDAVELPGIAALHSVASTAGEISCGAPGSCAMGGRYKVGPHRHTRAFVTAP